MNNAIQKNAELNGCRSRNFSELWEKSKAFLLGIGATHSRLCSGDMGLVITYSGKWQVASSIQCIERDVYSSSQEGTDPATACLPLQSSPYAAEQNEDWHSSLSLEIK
jgi:hypothetical protein